MRYRKKICLQDTHTRKNRCYTIMYNVFVIEELIYFLAAGFFELLTLFGLLAFFGVVVLAAFFAGFAAVVVDVFAAVVDGATAAAVAVADLVAFFAEPPFAFDFVAPAAFFFGDAAFFFGLLALALAAALGFA